MAVRPPGNIHVSVFRLAFSQPSGRTDATFANAEKGSAARSELSATPAGITQKAKKKKKARAKKKGKVEPVAEYGLLLSQLLSKDYFDHYKSSAKCLKKQPPEALLNSGSMEISHPCIKKHSVKAPAKGARETQADLKRRKVHWNDTEGKELVQVREFDRSCDLQEDGESHACLCVIQ